MVKVMRPVLCCAFRALKQAEIRGFWNGGGVFMVLENKGNGGNCTGVFVRILWRRSSHK